MKLSVVVISYNVAPHLLRCLASLRGADEVIVVDNASPDDSAQHVRQEFPHAHLVEMESNLGFSAAVNRGVAQATGDLILILNPDTVLEPGSLARMGDAMAQQPRNVWAMGFRQVDGANHFQLSFGPPPSLTLELLRRVVQRRLDAGDARVEWVLNRLMHKKRVVPWVSGAALLVRRQAFDQVQGFDERFFLYFEDIDFCLRLRQAGGQVVYDPSVTLTHLRGESARTKQTLAQRAYRESQLYFWQKHRGRWVRHLVKLYLHGRGLAP